MAVRGKKGAKAALGVALRTGNSTNTKIAGVPSTPTIITTGFGSSVGSMTLATVVSQTNPVMLRVFTSGTTEPSAWSGVGPAYTMGTVCPTTAFLWTWKGNKSIITANPATLSGSTTPTLAQYNAMRSKWINIFATQTPDVRKDGGMLDTVGWWHEPFKATANDVNPGPWSQAHINLAEWVRQANLSRTNKLAVCGVMNGHSQAQAHFNEFFPPALLAVTDPQIQIGSDCYQWNVNPNQQITFAHDFAVSKGNHPWCVPELGWIIHTLIPRPTDAQALSMAQTVHADVQGWTPASRPKSILWFNNGGQPFNGNDTLSDSPPEAVTVPLPTAMAAWASYNP